MMVPRILLVLMLGGMSPGAKVRISQCDSFGFISGIAPYLTKETRHLFPDLKDPQITVEYQEAKQFIWEHWKQQKPGYGAVEYYSLDSGPSVTIFFVEQDELGEWGILTRIVKYASGLRGEDRAPIKTEGESFWDRLERVRTGTAFGRAVATSEVVPISEDLPPQKYSLRFSNSRTGIVQHMN